MIGDSANRIRRTQECRELATLLTGLPLSLALWPVVSVPFLLSFHIPLNLISVLSFCFHFSIAPASACLPWAAFLYHSFPSKPRPNPLFSARSQLPLFACQALFLPCVSLLCSDHKLFGTSALLSLQGIHHRAPLPDLWALSG